MSVLTPEDTFFVSDLAAVARQLQSGTFARLTACVGARYMPYRFGMESADSIVAKATLWPATAV